MPPLESIVWKKGSGADLHLVPGLVSPRLDQVLTITDGGMNFRAHAPPVGVTVTWTASFVAGAAGCAGVTVSTGTHATGANGEIRVSLPLSPSPRLLDFLVTATVADAATPTALDAYVRVHIHERIVRAWLTPSPLTVQVNASNVRFSVLAEFEDGSYGDISNWSPWEVDPHWPADLNFVRMLANVQPVFNWGSSVPSDLSVDPMTGVLDCNRGGANVSIQAGSTLPGGIASGTAVGGGGWALGGTVEKIEGPGFPTMATTPNILILGDGFTAADRPGFISLARLLVADLHKDTLLNPYNLLKDSISYFAALLPSREAGVSTLSPVDRVPIPGGTLGNATDVDVAIPRAAATTTPATIAAPVPNTTRYLLNERDTAFGAMFGERPRAERFRPTRVIGLSERRFNEGDLDIFLGALKDPTGATVGQHWVRGGKDDTSIVILCRTAHYGGSNTSRTPEPGLPPSGNVICAAFGSGGTRLIDHAAAGRGHDIVPDAIPAVGAVVMRLIVAHEVGHSFTLGDEYGGSGGPLPASLLGRANAKANVQARATVAPAGIIDATKIKWGIWPRIRKAGVLTAAPVASGANFRLLLKPRHAKPFVQGDIVRLRTHPLPTSVQSDRLRVVQRVSDAELEVAPLGAINAAGFPAGSIVMAPLRGPDQGGALGADLSLIHADVLAHIQDPLNRNPLNAAYRAAPDRPCPGVGEPVYKWSTPTLNLGPGNAPVPPLESAWITGLFEKGLSHDCAVYHPTGACLMNVLSFDAFTSSFQFCWVCRYAMVDFIDPTQHGKVDKSYAGRYPT